MKENGVVVGRGWGGGRRDLVAVNEGMDTHPRRVCWASVQLKPES